MIIRVNWAVPVTTPGEIPTLKMYHTYQASEYFVEFNLNPNGTTDSIRLMLDGDKHDISLSGDDVAYIMNDEGKTIDSIRT